MRQKNLTQALEDITKALIHVKSVIPLSITLICKDGNYEYAGEFQFKDTLPIALKYYDISGQHRISIVFDLYFSCKEKGDYEKMKKYISDDAKKFTKQFSEVFRQRSDVKFIIFRERGSSERLTVRIIGYSD